MTIQYNTERSFRRGRVLVFAQRVETARSRKTSSTYALVIREVAHLMRGSIRQSWQDLGLDPSESAVRPFLP
jgi:hypothetical protein